MNNSRIIILPHNFIPRDYQRSFWEFMERGGKRAVLCWHRRSGKDKTCWNFLIKESLKKTGVYYYIFPTYSQGKKILWDGIDKQGFRFLEHIPPELMDGTPNTTELKIRLINGSLIQIIGSNNIDSIVGTNPVGCVFSEYALQDPRAWSYISPILAENGGWVVFESTPRGKNHFFDLYKTAEAHPKWFSLRLTVEDTNVISHEILKEERKNMSEDMINQEYFCSFDMGVEGSYYARYMERARDEERIGHFPYNPDLPVHTAWDLGFRDGTVILFFQVKGERIIVIDCHEDHGKSLSEYIRVVKGKPYVYGKHFAPHDVKNRHLSTGLSSFEIAGKLGISFLIIPNHMSIAEGIECCRINFPRISIDSHHAKRLIKCLENYRKVFDPVNRTYSSKPLHDEFSHAADAFRYMNVGLKRFGVEENEDYGKQMDELFRRHRPVFPQ